MQALTRVCYSLTARMVRGRMHVSGLEAADYRLQGNRKMKDGDSYPGRDARLEHQHDGAVVSVRRSPMISVDTKERGARGPCKNGRHEQHQKVCRNDD
ncbi:MAG: ISAzo13-like element transposase-related protein [Acidiferrobacteraceae bacterium]